MWWSPPQARQAPAAQAIGVASPPLTFEELLAAEHESLFRALYLITGSAQESEELMQDAFLKVFDRWDRLHVTRR